MTPKFSVVIIARDEAKSLPRLLDSLREFRDRGGDVVLVDNGSNDGTGDIALKWGCYTREASDTFMFTVDRATAVAINRDVVVIGERPVIWGGNRLFNYSEARNYASSLAVNDMICCPDADEVFTHLDIDAVNGAVCLSWWDRFENDHCYLHDKDGNPSNRFFWDARWYDRRAFKWVGTMHETLKAFSDVQTSRTFRLPTEVCYIEHWPKPSQNKEKYLANLAFACHVDPTNERQAHCFARQLMFEGRYKSAIKAFTRHILLNKENFYAYHAHPQVGSQFLHQGPGPHGSSQGPL